MSMVRSFLSRRAAAATVLAGCATLAALALPSAATAAEAIRILTEEYPPYNFTENGRITGMGTEVVRAVLKEIGVDGQFQSMPWARAYETAQTTSDMLIYSINRSPEREKLFKWVGNIAPSDWYFFSLKSRGLRLADLADARKLQTGTVNQDVGEQFLSNHGFAVGHNLQSSAKYELNYEKLQLGRIDLWVMNELGAYHIVRQAGGDPAKVLNKTLRIPELGSGGNYMAFSAKTDDALVEKFRRGLETVKRNGTYDAIQKKWL